LFQPLKSSLTAKVVAGLAIEVFTMPERHVVYALSDLNVFLRGCDAKEFIQK